MYIIWIQRLLYQNSPLLNDFKSVSQCVAVFCSHHKRKWFIIKTYHFAKSLKQTKHTNNFIHTPDFLFLHSDHNRYEIECTKLYIAFICIIWLSTIFITKNRWIFNSLISKYCIRRIFSIKCSLFLLVRQPQNQTLYHKIVSYIKHYSLSITAYTVYTQREKIMKSSTGFKLTIISSKM